MTRTEFQHLMQLLTTAWHDRRILDAFSVVDEVLDRGAPEMKVQALLFQGMIKEEEADLSGAIKDWSSLLDFGVDSFLRHRAQCLLGKANEHLGMSSEARAWYWAALVTCQQSGEFSGVDALCGFWRYRGSGITDEERTVLVAVVEKSWRVHDLPDLPFLDDLGTAIVSLENGVFEQRQRILNGEPFRDSPL
jgi:hypothetical protein